MNHDLPYTFSTTTDNLYHALRGAATSDFRKAIRAACDEIAGVSISFPGDKKSWEKIIERHLKPLIGPE